MPKSTPPRDPESSYFENLGRMNAAAGIQWLMPRLNSWLGEQLQSMLTGLDVPREALAKPVRNSLTQAATEASLGLLVNGPRVKRPYVKRGTRDATLSGMDMIDGRYTKVGAARVLGIHPAGLYRHLGDVHQIRVRIPNTVKGSCITYDAAAVDALAAERNVEPAPVPVVTLDKAEKYRKGMNTYWAGKTKEQRQEIMQARFAKRKDAWAAKVSERMAQGLPPKSRRKPKVIDVTLGKTTRKGVRK